MKFWAPGMRLALLIPSACGALLSKSQSDLQHILEGKMSIPLSLQAIQRPGRLLTLTYLNIKVSTYK